MQKQHSTQVRPTQVWPDNYRRGPVEHQQTLRTDGVSVITSSFGGTLTPLKMIPLLREDGIINSRLSINVQMAETADMLLNPIRVSAMAYLVPKLAFERFADMGTIDRSYNGIEEVNGDVVPWFKTMTMGAEPNEIFKALGLHAAEGNDLNLDYVEAYNAVWNYIAKQRSTSLDLRDGQDTTLAPAFWEHTQMRHVVPTFDAAMVEGEIPIAFTQGGELPVFSAGSTQGGGSRYVPTGVTGDASQPPNDGTTWDWTDRIWAELDEQSVKISLANIEQARETRVWAQMRNQFQGMSEDWMIDQLMQGLRLNDETLKQPILLDHSDTIIGMNQRYATDGDNLDKSVADGRTSLQLQLRAPALQTGGVVVICAQALPEMLYERQRDYYLNATTVEQLPNRTSDELDPQPVSLIRNGEIDESHTLPNDLFGYAPLNHEWVRRAPNVGGKYYRASPSDPWNENRNRIWSTEVVDPTLGPDFYISSEVSHEVFADQNTDPFEWWVAGDVRLQGLTFFGPQLREAQDDYNKVESQVPTERLKGDGTDV